MRIEVIDPVTWEPIVNQIDEDFGIGVTKRLVGDRIPVMIRREKEFWVHLIPTWWLARLRPVSEAFQPISMGQSLGSVVGGKLRLSISMIEHLSRITSSVISVSTRGAEAFTYGGSILKESVLSIRSDVRRGQKVVVTDRSGVCLGLASMSVDSSKLEKLARNRLVAKNLTDIGWYVRRLG